MRLALLLTSKSIESSIIWESSAPRKLNRGTHRILIQVVFQDHPSAATLKGHLLCRSHHQSAAIHQWVKISRSQAIVAHSVTPAVEPQTRVHGFLQQIEIHVTIQVLQHYAVIIVVSFTLCRLWFHSLVAHSHSRSELIHRIELSILLTSKTVLARLTAVYVTALKIGALPVLDERDGRNNLESLVEAMVKLILEIGKYEDRVVLVK